MYGDVYATFLRQRLKKQNTRRIAENWIRLSRNPPSKKDTTLTIIYAVGLACLRDENSNAVGSATPSREFGQVDRSVVTQRLLSGDGTQTCAQL